MYKSFSHNLANVKSLICNVKLLRIKSEVRVSLSAIGNCLDRIFWGGMKGNDGSELFTSETSQVEICVMIIGVY